MIDWPYLEVLDGKAIEYILEKELEYFVATAEEPKYVEAARALLPYVSVKWALLEEKQEEGQDGLGESAEAKN